MLRGLHPWASKADKRLAILGACLWLASTLAASIWIGPWALSDPIFSAMCVFGLSITIFVLMIWIGNARSRRFRSVWHCRNRTRDFRSAYSQSPEHAAALCLKVTDRRNAFELQVRGLPLVRMTGHLLFNRTFLGVLWLLAMFSPAARVTFQLPRSSAAFAAIDRSLVFAPFLICLFILTMLTLLVRRVKRSVAELSCPDCGYPLADLPPGLPTPPSSPTIGPARCPECGSPWPLVPPSLESLGLRA